MLKLTQGGTKTITITLKDTTGSAFNLTGYTMAYLLKRNRTDADADAVLSGAFTISTPATGVGTLALTSANLAYLAGLYYLYIYITLTSSGAITPVFRDTVLVELK